MQNSCNTIVPWNMAYFRYIIVNTLHKCDDDDDDDDNNNNNNNNNNSEEQSTSWEANRFSDTNKFAAFYGNVIFITALTTARQLSLF